MNNCNLNCTSSNQLQCYADQNPFNTDLIQTSAGRVFPNALASQTVGRNGPILLRDVFLIDKLQKGNRERIAPRIGHAKGTGRAQQYFLINDN